MFPFCCGSTKAGPEVSHARTLWARRYTEILNQSVDQLFAPDVTEGYTEVYMAERTPAVLLLLFFSTTLVWRISSGALEM